MYCKICDKDYSDTEVTRWENEIYCPDCGHSIKLTDSRNKKLIDMDSKLINLARSNYEKKTTSELLSLLENNYQDEYLMEAVEVIKQILTERGVSHSSQKLGKIKHEMEKPEERIMVINYLGVSFMLIGAIIGLIFGAIISSNFGISLGGFVMACIDLYYRWNHKREFGWVRFLFSYGGGQIGVPVWLIGLSLALGNR
jgi:uncharacterized Zn finger protein (UPF0148 family)